MKNSHGRRKLSLQDMAQLVVDQRNVKRAVIIAACQHREDERQFQYVKQYDFEILRPRHRTYLPRHVESDAVFSDDLSYVPNRYIRGTIHIPDQPQKHQGLMH